MQCKREYNIPKEEGRKLINCLKLCVWKFQISIGRKAVEEDTGSETIVIFLNQQILSK
jgi:hypothetical protein